MTYLSFPSNMTNEILSEKQKELIKHLKFKADVLIKSNHKYKKLETHEIFSNSVLSLIVSGNLSNFLRKSFIQKMFFTHNRLYNYQFLNKILLKNSEFWNKLLKENNVGNPVPFFLYKLSSGNRIRQVYLLKEIFEFSKINSVNSVIEIGGGYGSMTSIIHKINQNVDYTIFDLPEVNLLQFYYLNSLKIDCEISGLNKNISLLSELSLLKKKINSLKSKNQKILLIANWSLSEMPISLRQELEFLFLSCDYAIISFQSNFEEISNISYFENLRKKLEPSFLVSINPINEMNTIFNSNKNFKFLIKKIN